MCTYVHIGDYKCTELICCVRQLGCTPFSCLSTSHSMQIANSNFYLMSSQFILYVTVFVCLKKAVTKKLNFSVVAGQRNLMHRHTSFVVFAPVAGRDSLTYPRKSFYTCLPPPLRDHKSVRISRVFSAFCVFAKVVSTATFCARKPKKHVQNPWRIVRFPVRRRKIRESTKKNEKSNA